MIFIYLQHLFIILFISFETVVSGFCVYSQLPDHNVRVVQIDNFGNSWTSKFAATLQPNQDSCCNYHNVDCNAHQYSNDALTVFAVYANVNGERRGLRTLYLPSGGYSIIKGEPDQLVTENYDANGQPFDYQGFKYIADDRLPQYLNIIG
ncbi:hypothetical protein BJ944DRAFT_290745 [Cunninghamella echinulata]|nr:hypothetical protein BJ944DRAFT_290745 [Cunninghamella echinulata]